jgi:hypothetical protein
VPRSPPWKSICRSPRLLRSKRQSQPEASSTILRMRPLFLPRSSQSINRSTSKSSTRTLVMSRSRTKPRAHCSQTTSGTSTPETSAASGTPSAHQSRRQRPCQRRLCRTHTRTRASSKQLVRLDHLYLDLIPSFLLIYRRIGYHVPPLSRLTTF